jgi:transcriptional regulator with XRE-family HTH domain
MSKRSYRGRKKTATDEILNKAIGKKIKEARLNNIILIKDINWKGTYRPIKKIVTQSKLANALHPPKTFQQIQKYEKGRNGVSTIILLQISKFFNKPLEYFTSEATELLGQENPPSNNPKSTAPSLDTNGINLKSDFH